MLTTNLINYLNQICLGEWTECNGIINVNGYVNICYSGIIKFPVHFGKVKGSFSCNHNRLSILKGTPSIIKGFFDCSSNQLTTLQAGPKEVGGYYSCSCNKLTNLIGAPEICNGNFYCSDNKLTSLEDGPKIIRGSYSCSDNNLTSLIGALEICNDSFCCEMNKLTSLEGCPKVIKGNLHCQNNPDLKYLWGIGRVENEVHYDNENELNEWIIMNAQRDFIFPHFNLEENMNWIKSIGQYSCLLRAPDEIRQYFSSKILNLVDSGIC